MAVFTSFRFRIQRPSSLRVASAVGLCGLLLALYAGIPYLLHRGAVAYVRFGSGTSGDVVACATREECAHTLHLPCTTLHPLPPLVGEETGRPDPSSQPPIGEMCDMTLPAIECRLDTDVSLVCAEGLRAVHGWHKNSGKALDPVEAAQVVVPFTAVGGTLILLAGVRATTILRPRRRHVCAPGSAA